MIENKLDNFFWNLRYQHNETGWDLGKISEPIKAWFDNQENKKINLLVPGAGVGYEVKYGFENGFENIFYMDFSSRAADLFKEICPLFPKEQILIGDFFSLKRPLFFDVIITFRFKTVYPHHKYQLFGARARPGPAPRTKKGWPGPPEPGGRIIIFTTEFVIGNSVEVSAQRQTLTLKDSRLMLSLDFS